MKFFWPIYVLAAVVGTAVVYVAAPLARPYVESVFGKREEVLRPAKGGGAEGAPVLKPGPTPAPALIAPVSPAAVAEDDGDENPPALNGIYLASSSEKPGWGITINRATYYGLDGTRLGQVEGGVLLDYREARVSSIGNMVECVLLDSKIPAVPRLITRKDVYLFTGAHAKLSAKQRANLQAYYALSGKIGVRKNELLQAAAAANPFFAAYNQAYRAYMAHIDEAKALASKRDRAAGSEKSRIEDRLREMKMSETALRTQHDAAHAKFRKWKDEHAGEIAKAENDPDVLRWSREMQTLRSRVPGLTF